MSTFLRNKQFIHYVITLVIMFGFGYLPPIAPITSFGMEILGVFLGAVYGWTVINILWPSIFGIIVLGFHVGMASVLQGSFGSPVVVMLFTLYVLLGVMEECGATKVLATFFISNRLTNGRPWVFVYLMLLGSYACAQIHPFVAILLFIGFTQQVCRIFDLGLPSKFSMLMAIGISISCMFGQLTFPFLAAGLTLSASFQAMSGYAMAANSYVMFMIPLHLILLLVYTGIMKFVFRTDLSKLKNLTSETFGQKEPLTEEQKVSLLGALVFLVLALSAAFLPQGWVVTQILNKISIFGQISIVVCVLMICVTKSGKPLINYSVLSGKYIQWDTIFIAAVILALSNYLGQPETGIGQALSAIMQPLLSFPPIVFIIVTMLIAVIVTNFMNNIVVIVIMMPMMINILGQLPGISCEGIILLLFIIAQYALFTPAASVYIGICFATEELVETKTMMRYALMIVPIMFIVTLLLGVPYSTLVFR